MKDSQKKYRENYQIVSEEEKNRKRQYGRDRYKNLSEDEQQKLAEYRKRYYEMRKNQNASQIKID